MTDRDHQQREPSGDREAEIIATFVALADTMIDSYDLIEFLALLAQRCVTLLPSDEAGIMIADARGNLQTVASSGDRAEALELFELRNDEGPCVESYRTGVPVHSADLRTEAERWPRFTATAVSVGFGSVYSWPLRVRREVIGALNLFGHQPRAMTDADRSLANAMANVATIGILQQRAIETSRALSAQLQLALSSRVLIEQAKGVVSERNTVSIDVAFEMLRSTARSQRRTLTEIARAVVNGQLRLDRNGP